MKLDPRGILRDARYALPGMIGRMAPGPGPQAAARICQRLADDGLLATAGFFQADDSTPEDILAANTELAALLGMQSGSCYLSVKTPPLSFDMNLLGRIAEACRAAGQTILFDAHAPKDVEATLDAVAALLERYPGTGCVLPARWRRSHGDASRFRETTARIRIVKGEWADPEQDCGDIDAGFLDLVRTLAGRAAPVAVATHKPELAEAALPILLDAGTPCELEQLRGLPRRRTSAIARRLGVPIRVYVPFGPWWWPYAVDKALARPYLPVWFLHDLMG